MDYVARLQTLRDDDAGIRDKDLTTGVFTPASPDACEGRDLPSRRGMVRKHLLAPETSLAVS